MRSIVHDDYDINVSGKVFYHFITFSSFYIIYQFWKYLLLSPLTMTLLQTMKAVVFNGPYKVSLQTRPIPSSVSAKTSFNKLCFYL